MTDHDVFIQEIADLLLEKAKIEREKQALPPSCTIIGMDKNGHSAVAPLIGTPDFFSGHLSIKYRFPAIVRKCCQGLKTKGVTPIGIITIIDIWFTYYLTPGKGEIVFEKTMPSQSPNKMEALVRRIDKKNQAIFLLTPYESIDKKIVYSSSIQPDAQTGMAFVDLPKYLFPSDL